MKLFSKLICLVILFATQAQASDSVKISCQFSDLPQTLNRFSTQLEILRQENNVVFTTFNAEVAKTGAQSSIATGPIEVIGPVTQFPSGEIAVGPTTVYDLQSADGQTHLKIVLGLKGPYSILMNDGIPYKSDCE